MRGRRQVEVAVAQAHRLGGVDRRPSTGNGLGRALFSTRSSLPTISIAPVGRSGFTVAGERGTTVPPHRDHELEAVRRAPPHAPRRCARDRSTTCTSPVRSRRSMKMTPPWSRRPCTQPMTVTACGRRRSRRSVPAIVAAFPVAERRQPFSHPALLLPRAACAATSARAPAAESSTAERQTMVTPVAADREPSRGPRASSSSPSERPRSAPRACRRGRIALLTLRPAASSSQRMPVRAQASRHAQRRPIVAAAESGITSTSGCAFGGTVAVGRHQRGARDRSRSRSPAQRRPAESCRDQSVVAARRRRPRSARRGCRRRPRKRCARSSRARAPSAASTLKRHLGALQQAARPRRSARDTAHEVIADQRRVGHHVPAALLFAVEQTKRIAVEPLAAVGAERVDVRAAVGRERGAIRRGGTRRRRAS